MNAGASISNIMLWFDGLNLDQVQQVVHFVVSSLQKAPAL